MIGIFKGEQVAFTEEEGLVSRKKKACLFVRDGPSNGVERGSELVVGHKPFAVSVEPCKHLASKKPG